MNGMQSTMLALAAVYWLTGSTALAQRGVGETAGVARQAGKPEIIKVQFDTQDEASTAVALGKADAMSADSPISAYAVKQSDGKMQLVGDVFDSAPYALGSHAGIRIYSGSFSVYTDGDRNFGVVVADRVDEPENGWD